MPTSIRVMIVDDHPAVRLGLSTFLDLCDDLELIGEAENGQQAVELIERKKPDVVLMDLVMPIMDGVTATHIIHQRYPYVQVIVLTSTVDYDIIDKAIAAGARSYMLKDVSIDTMADAIRSVAG